MIAIIEQSTQRIVATYEGPIDPTADVKSYLPIETLRLPLFVETDYVHVEIPVGETIDSVSPAVVDDVWTLAHDQVKLDAWKRQQNQQARAAFAAARAATADANIKQILISATGQEADDITHAMVCIHALSVTLDATATPEDKAVATGTIEAYKPVYALVQAERQSRDEEITDFEPLYQDIDPIY